MHTWGLFVYCERLVTCVKDFQTLDQQVDLLSSRKLIIEDRQAAKRFLLRNNYYRVSGYSLTLRDHDEFYPNTKIEDIEDIYRFDVKLRNALLEAIETLETTLKSIYAYKFSEKYGPIGYLNPKNFRNQIEYERIRAKVNRQVETRLMGEAYLKHFLQDLNENIPFWAYVDLLSIADISQMYNMSDEDIKDAVAGLWGILPANRAEILSKHMHCITILRNICAHGGRLFNRLFVTKPSLNSKEKALLRRNEDNQIDNAHLFGYVLIIKRLLPAADFQTLKNRIIAISQDIPFVALRYYGFPDNWEEVI